MATLPTILGKLNHKLGGIDQEWSKPVRKKLFSERKDQGESWVTGGGKKDPG